MKTKRKPSAVPYYAAGISWILYACIFSLYRVWEFVLIAGISIMVYLLFRRKFPGEEIQVEVIEKPVMTGNEELDEVLSKGQEALKSMKRLKESIQSKTIHAYIEEMETVSRKIFDYVKKEPGKTRTVGTFMSYYLPTGLKLLRTYQELEAQDSSGENITGSLQKIEEVMELVVEAFRKELDGLFAGTAMDVEVEAATLNMMMDKHGLKF